MIKSNKKLQVVTAQLNVLESIIIEPNINTVSVDLNRDVYSLKVQDFYLIDDVKYPIEQRGIEVDIAIVSAKIGTLKEKIEQAVLDKINESAPYGSTVGDWELIQNLD